jgi:sugar lactone lactonase YvrE
LTGVQVFDAGGQYLGTIKVPRQPANVALGGPDKRTLYSTACEALYGIKALSQDRIGSGNDRRAERLSWKNILIGCILAGFEHGASC